MTESPVAEARILPDFSRTPLPPVRRAHSPGAPRWAPQSYPLAIATAVLVASAALKRNDSEQLVLPWLNMPLPPLCYFRSYLGIDCAGCGLTRAFVCLANGEFAAAWFLNPASFLVFGFVLLQIPLRLYQLARIARGQQTRIFTPWSTATIVTILVALYAQWIVRLVLA